MAFWVVLHRNMIEILLCEIKQLCTVSSDLKFKKLFKKIIKCPLLLTSSFKDFVNLRILKHWNHDIWPHFNDSHSYSSLPLDYAFLCFHSYLLLCLLSPYALLLPICGHSLPSATTPSHCWPSSLQCWLQPWRLEAKSTELTKGRVINY